MKVVENSPQNARNCTILKNFLVGACPQTPITIARDHKSKKSCLTCIVYHNVISVNKKIKKSYVIVITKVHIVFF